MSVFKRGRMWWYKFNWNGESVRESTKQTNKRTAEQIEAAHRTALAKGEVGIREKASVPTLQEFGPRFKEAIRTQCAEKPRTVAFYEAKVAFLLKDPELATARLDMIEEAAVEAYKQRRSKVQSRRKKPIAPATVNRELATLRRLLRMAQEWKVIQRVPRIRLLRGEKTREFVLSCEQERAYLDFAPQQLREVATLLLDTGLRVGEALSLEWPQVHLEPASGASFGYVTILSGKAKSRKSRNVPLSPRAVQVLRRWQPRESGLVFTRDGLLPLSATWLDQQHAKLRRLMKLPPDCVLHSLRHTFGTRLGESGADAFTIMKLMGHSSVTVSQRYVHPSPEAVELAYARMDRLNQDRAHKLGTNLGTTEVGASVQAMQVQ